KSKEYNIEVVRDLLKVLQVVRSTKKVGNLWCTPCGYVCPPPPGLTGDRIYSAVPAFRTTKRWLSGAYLFKRVRATSPTCLQYLTEEDTAEHTLLECPYWSAFRAPLATQLGHSPSAVDIGDIMCGPPFDQLPADPDEKWEILRNAEDTFRLFYRMVEGILSTKEEEERARQSAEPDTE
ncbi:Uncharacterized protein FWK35_00037709, partial [Aphis craccivora]